MPTSGSIVTVVNQTGRPATYNLAPVSDQAVSLPPHGRIDILEEELSAYEVQGAIKASPPRLAVIRKKVVQRIPAETIPAKVEPAPQPMPMEESTPSAPGAVAVPVVDQEEATEPKVSGWRKSKRAKQR